MLIALFGIADLILRVLGWIIIAQIVLSLLLAFNVINPHSGAMRSLIDGLDRLTAPSSAGPSAPPSRSPQPSASIRAHWPI